jgi:excinuclease ABC subunit A
MEILKIRGARVHNLKNINLDIPKNKLVVFTGVSGSGKSSLAFDTIYAEGQRRYVESLSSYARQFLGIMDKPDVDLIEGLSPAISIDQKSSSGNPRSTVGTVTEVYDYLRLLYARVGTPHCPECGRPVHKLSFDQITKLILTEIESRLKSNKHSPVRLMVMSPIVRGRRGEFKELFDNLLSKGYERVRIDGYYHSLDEDLFILKNNKHYLDLIVDRLSINYQHFKKNQAGELSSRLFKAIEQASLLSDGLVMAVFVDDAGFNFPENPQKTEEILYSQQMSCSVCNLALPKIEPSLFSFNSPLGACSRCKGLGTVLRADPQKMINENLSITEGGIFPFQKLFYQDTWFGRLFRTFLEKNGLDPEKPLNQLTSKQERALFEGTGQHIYDVSGLNRHGEETTIHEPWRGLLQEVEARYYETDSEYSRGELSKYMQEEICPQCHGARLNKEALSVTLDGRNINQFTNWSIAHALKFLVKLPQTLSEKNRKIASSIIKELQTRLSFLVNVGLAYLTLSRRANTLSGGEAQRIRLASQIGTGLTGITYVLDEPSIGLHPRDIDRLLRALLEMRNLKNTVIVVEHDWDTIQAADWLVDFGPKAGKGGGEIVYSGLKEGITTVKKSLTGQYLSKAKKIPTTRNDNQPTQFMTFKGCREHNLKNIDVKIPLGRMVGITGVSGSGKSSLLLDTIYTVVEHQLNPHYRGRIGSLENFTGLSQIQRVVLIDQSPIGRTPRSNPATYTGCFTEIRKVFSETLLAKSLGYQPGRFSFNVRGGRCENCQGAGVIKVEMQFLSDVYVRCDTCLGKRYNRETLGVTYKGKNISDILKMTVEEALSFFANHYQIQRILKTMKEVGLGYIELGQSATTLSGGEAQRVKLAKELYTNLKFHSLYLLDEPTTGLHMDDIKKLLQVLRALVSQGNTVILIEHNLEVIKNCDYLIDLGPEGGEKGGQLLFAGSCKNLIKTASSYTGRYLQQYLK